ncbi:ABC transporter substrate-binding protein [Maribacter sp. CXY002]|uniref:ABC transporter substrate-binding protein n=1 Tax=Maribacter luteocoastalis TaxID=3407671 RepID=UPI003B66E76A
MKQLSLFLFVLLHVACKSDKKEIISEKGIPNNVRITHATGFTIEKTANGITLIKITSPWPNAEASFTYALIPKEKLRTIPLEKEKYDAIIPTPVETIVVTSTTHIPALDALGVLDKLIGFPDTKYISSEKANNYVALGKIKDIGINESLNTELTIALQPEVLVGFGVNGQNSTYETLKRSNIPVVYNGDWTEATPLGKAEWIKFFAPFFDKEKEAELIFSKIQTAYNEVKQIASKAKNRPTVLSGAMYKDVWYLPGGNSWAAQFIKDANADYLWKDNLDTGSLSLSWEHVLQKAKDADYWISPAQFISYEDMINTSSHYKEFASFTNKTIYTFANTIGASGGILYYELAPQRPDLVLRDLVYILHPELLPDHDPFFFKLVQ